MKSRSDLQVEQIEAFSADVSRKRRAESIWLDARSTTPKEAGNAVGEGVGEG